MVDSILKTRLYSLISDWERRPFAADEHMATLRQLGDRHSVIAALEVVERDLAGTTLTPFLIHVMINEYGDNIWPGG